MSFIVRSATAFLLQTLAARIHSVNPRSKAVETTIEKLQRQLKALKVYCGILTIIVISGTLLAFRNEEDKEGIIRVKGIIVEDASGKDRILIGAPIPESNNRTRSNFERAKATWGKRYPSFDWYKNLMNSTNGIIILDDHGFDKIAMGDPVPDPNIGKRIAPSVGIAINDNEGFERTGWGFFPDNNRVVLGLDNDKVTEGLVMSVLEDGSVGLSINAERNNIYLGTAPSNGIATALKEAFHGLLIRDSAGIAYKFSAFEKKQK